MTALDKAEFDCVLFDLDDTLYEVPEIARVVRSNIMRYIEEELRVPAAEVQALTMKLYQEHGTTMAGLVAAGHKIDYEHFHEKVHATLDYASLLHPNGVRDLLAQVTATKHIFTNADAKHTAVCLERLGISGCFESIWCFETVQQLLKAPEGAPPQVLCKPNRRAFALVLQQLGVAPGRAVFIDDSPRNCAAAHEEGIFSVLVGREGHVAGADLVIPSIHDLPRVLPGLFAPPEPPRVEAAAEVGVPIQVPA
ncbi:MAG: HAD-like domain-containing protein [Monoraphidium minutum]|nr:MAG: HAD-like domain-containing protein [Monoraphidium minutum]